MQSNFSLNWPPHSRLWSFRCVSILAVALAAAIFFAAADASHAATSGRIQHVVIFWLKRPGNQQDRSRLVRASENFRAIPGVLRVEAGQALPARRPGIEQSFDLCVVFTLRDRAALQRFDSDPRHQRAAQTVLKPLVQRYSVFNSILD